MIFFRGHLGLWFFLLACVAKPSFSGDRGDMYLSGYFGWDMNRKARNSGLIYGLQPWNEVGFGFGLEQSEEFSAPTLDARWMIEPFEFYLNPQLAYYAVKRGWFGQLSMGFNYLISITSKTAAFFAIKGYFPHKEKRSLYLGIGLRYLF